MSWSSQSTAPSSSISTLSPETTSYANWQQRQPSTQSPPRPSKRSRITRACDTCKKKKTKCDVDNCFPCTTCQQYDWACTFNETSRKRGPPKGYIGSLEERLERMEQLLCKLQGNNTHTTNSAHSPTLSLQSHDHTDITNSTLLPSSTETNAPPHLHDSLTDQQSGKYSLPSKRKIVRYLGSSSGLYLVNDILRDQPNNNTSNGTSTLTPLSTSSKATATIYTNCEHDQLSGNSTTDSNSAYGAALPGKQYPSNQLSHQSIFKSPMTAGNIKSAAETHIPPKDDITFTSLETKQGTCRLRRVNGFDDDLVLVRDETEAETKIQAEAANEQEYMDSIVPRSMLANLVKVYFDTDCGTLPILDQEEFMDSFEGKTIPPPAPLLTYAICSYSCFLVPSDHPLFTQSGLNRNEIFQALIDRAGLFMRSEYLIPRIQTIQALILLCAHPTLACKSNRNWVLSGMAVRMAQDLGLHRLVTNNGECSIDTIEKRRRLWYSVYLTDRWCCCVLGRPLAITDSDCDVDLPSVDTVDHPGKHALFVNLVKLSGILGEVLRRIYSSKAKSMGYGTHVMEQTVWSLDKMLKEWCAQVPQEYLITPDQLQGMKGVEQTYENKFRLGGPLTVCYYAVVILLFRPFLVFEDCKHHSSKLFDDAPKRCMNAAMNSIDVARHIPKEQIPRFGWNFAAYSVYQAALIHVYNCTNTDSTIAQTSRHYTRIAVGECVAPISDDIPFGPPVLHFLTVLINMTKADPSYDDHSASKGLESAPTSAIASCDPSDPLERPRFIPTDMGYSSGQPSTQISTEPSITAQHLVNNSILNTTNLLSSTRTNDTYIPDTIDLVNSITTQNSLFENQSNTLTQASWQMLFSSAGTPFTNSASNLPVFDLSWENMYGDHIADSNFGL